MKKTSQSECNALRSDNILFLEAVCDDYGNNSRIYYLVEGCVCSCLAGGTGPREYIKEMMQTRCLSGERYRQYMLEWLGMEKDYPYLSGAGLLMVPVKTHQSVKFTDNRRNYNDAYSFYNFHFFDEDMDLQTDKGSIYLAGGFVIETTQSGSQNELGYERAKRVLAEMQEIWEMQGNKPACPATNAFR